MPTRRLIKLIPIGLLLLITVCPAHSQQVPYESNVVFMNTVAADLVKLLPRAMGSFLYQNRVGFARGMTFVERSIRVYPLKMKDLEELRGTAYARLMRDIPYCVQAFKGGDIKLDTSPSNLAARLGMISYWIFLQKLPAFPDLEYLEKFTLDFERMIGENIPDIWLFYDGYGDFKSLGELMERLKQEGMPTFRHVRNDEYAVRMRADTYAMFRAPRKYNRNMLFTNVDIMHIYNTFMNATLDAFVYIWKASGMDLAHPSYAAPPGTVVKRASRRRFITGGVLTRLRTQVAEDLEEIEGEEEAESKEPEAGPTQEPAEAEEKPAPEKPEPEAPAR
jgi:hypothetical protein